MWGVGGTRFRSYLLVLLNIYIYIYIYGKGICLIIPSALSYKVSLLFIYKNDLGNT